jgi:hypothetical protein
MSGEREILMIFFLKNRAKIAQSMRVLMRNIISFFVTKRIFPKRKLNISICRFQSNPTKNIPAASPI